MVRQAKGVVMAGGRGERFWPVSTVSKPKQFLNLTARGSLIQQTVDRVARIIPYRDIIVVTTEDFVSLAQEQLPQIPPKNFLVEPTARNTAPCIGLAALWLSQEDPEALMLVVPADHYIPDPEAFCDYATAIITCAQTRNSLVTLGITPTRPETGYGYIEVGGAIDLFADMEAFAVSRFVEKPDEQTARRYVENDRYLWNAGIFAWSARTILAEINQHLPDLGSVLSEIEARLVAGWQRAISSVFHRAPSISIDYGVLEKSNNVVVIPSRLEWDDLGSWSAVARLSLPDGQGNVFHGQVRAVDCNNVYIRSESRLVAALGVSDLIIVQTEDAVLICARDKAQDVRRIAGEVRNEQAGVIRIESFGRSDRGVEPD